MSSFLAWARIRRPLASLTLAAIAASSLSACSDKTFGPNVDCTDVGFVFIELNPEPTGIESYDVNAGESIQVVASLRQVTASEPSFNPLQGWSCRTTASAPVSGTVAFSTTNTDIVRLDPGGWIRGLSHGSATVTAASTSPAVSITFGVFVN